MKTKILFLLLFCTKLCFGQTLIQYIQHYEGERFGKNLTMSGDFSTFANTVSISTNTVSNILFYKKKENGFELDSYFPLYNYINSPVIYLSDNAQRCMVLKNFAGAGLVVPFVKVMENNGGNWIEVGDSLDIEQINPSNPGRRSCDLSSSGNSFVVRHETESNPNGIIKTYKYNGSEWQQKRQAIQSSSTTNALETVKMANNGNMLVITEIGEHPSITTWDFVNGIWEPRSSKINGHFDYMEIGENGELMVVINNVDKFINVFEIEENEWKLISDDIWSTIAKNTSNQLYFAFDIDLNLENDVFMATYRNNANQSSSVGIYNRVPDQPNWNERKMELTSKELVNYGGRYSDLSATGDTMFITYILENQGRGEIEIYEKPKDLTAVSEIPENPQSTNDKKLNIINIFPNPVGDILYYTSDIEIRKIDVYNTKGQFIQTVSFNEFMIDLSDLDGIGFYFIKIHTQKGIQTVKVMKSE